MEVFFLFFTAILKGVYPYSREELAFPIYKFVTYPLLCKTQLYSGVKSSLSSQFLRTFGHYSVVTHLKH